MMIAVLIVAWLAIVPLSFKGAEYVLKKSNHL